jgi:predicted MPP superfamily phosphohydrolase
MYNKDNHRLYVNRGLGWSVIPLRVNCTPEIVILEWAA